MISESRVGLLYKPKLSYQKMEEMHGCYPNCNKFSL
jgi:hypothetical protein